MTHPLLAPLTESQALVVHTVGQVWLDHSKWPHYSYVEWTFALLSG